MQVDYQSIKKFVQDRGLSIQWVQIGSDHIDCTYWLKAFDGLFCLESTIKANSDDGADFVANLKDPGNKPPISIASAFAAKTVGNKKLYKRIHGMSQAIVTDSNTITFTIPYTWAKITGVELVGGLAGDTASFFVLDTEAGTYSGYPNYQLNQFGFSVNVASNYYVYSSEYDADLHQGMKIKIVYVSPNDKTVGCNFMLNEVKS